MSPICKIGLIPSYPQKENTLVLQDAVTTTISLQSSLPSLGGVTSNALEPILHRILIETSGSLSNAELSSVVS